MYPGDGLPGYPRDAFIEDLVGQAAAEIRGCLDRGADVQIDFTEARLSLKLDPSGGAAERVRGPEQPGSRRADGGATGAGRGSHLPGR